MANSISEDGATGIIDEERYYANRLLLITLLWLVLVLSAGGLMVYFL